MMLARYTIVRGEHPLREGTFQDCQKHTSHCLRPDGISLRRYLADPSPSAWAIFEKEYIELLELRFTNNRDPFEYLAYCAQRNDVYIGCRCPTHESPDVWRCHTVLALEFMQGHFPELDVRFPPKLE